MSNAERISGLATRLRERAEADRAVLDLVRELADALFSALEASVKDLLEEAAIGLDSEMVRKPTASGGELLRFNWVSGRVIVAPVHIAAAVNPDFQFFRGVGPFGRIVVFRELIPDTTPFPICEIYVHPSGTYRAHGIGFPVQGDVHTKRDIESFAVTLLENLSGSITDVHKGLHETRLDPLSLEVLPKIGFDVPGAEE